MKIGELAKRARGGECPDDTLLRDPWNYTHFYILMDIAIHSGILKHLAKDIKINKAILVSAIVLDLIVLLAFMWVKVQSDMLVIWASLIGLILIFSGEKIFLKGR
tara:strand:+ start:149 stop:463 length:315 start_codon:yes stop_codon:yes gene_type:complete